MYLVSGQTSKAEPEICRSIQNGQALLALTAIQTATLSASCQRYPEAVRATASLFLFHHGKPEQAITELRKLAGRNPDDRMSRTRLIAAYVESGHAVEGQKLLAEALLRNLKDADGLMQRSALCCRGRENCRRPQRSPAGLVQGVPILGICGQDSGLHDCKFPFVEGLSGWPGICTRGVCRGE
jgi:hypothetical protein